MNRFVSSREIAEGVQIDFPQRSRRPLRRRLAWLSILSAILVSIWIGMEWRRGQHRVFAAGPVATAHAMIENDCQACHTTWAPLDRLLGWSDTESLRSIDNAKCLKCHDESDHHANQVPGHGHGGLSCADCHREHRHHLQLARVSDRQCLRCHNNLETTDGPSTAFHGRVTTFEPGQLTSHPEFALKRILSNVVDDVSPGESHRVWDVAARGDDGGLRDRAVLRFNHAVHLKSERNSEGRLIAGVRGADGQLVDLSNNCQACHQEDASGEYMKPISFEAHCRSCHPLLFQLESADGPREVPHVSPDLIRGWLTERFTLEALGDDRGEPPNESSVTTPRRILPGPPARDRLDLKSARTVRDRVAAAEDVVRQHVHTVFGYEAKGGCRFCHAVSEDKGAWRVEQPSIPVRWMTHSRFRHNSHRQVECAQCHEKVAGSRETSDILMPSIKTCRKCHTSQAETGGLIRGVTGARSDCVECHAYHGRDDQQTRRGTGVIMKAQNHATDGGG